MDEDYYEEEFDKSEYYAELYADEIRADRIKQIDEYIACRSPCFSSNLTNKEKLEALKDFLSNLIEISEHHIAVFGTTSYEQIEHRAKCLIFNLESTIEQEKKKEEEENGKPIFF